MSTTDHTLLDAPEDIVNQRHQTLTELRNATLLIHPTKPTHYAQPRIGEHDVLTWSIYQANTLVTTGLTTLDMLQTGWFIPNRVQYAQLLTDCEEHTFR